MSDTLFLFNKVMSRCEKLEKKFASDLVQQPLSEINKSVDSIWHLAALIFLRVYVCRTTSSNNWIETPGMSVWEIVCKGTDDIQQ